VVLGALTLADGPTRVGGSLDRLHTVTASQRAPDAGPGAIDALALDNAGAARATADDYGWLAELVVLGRDDAPGRSGAPRRAAQRAAVVDHALESWWR